MTQHEVKAEAMKYAQRGGERKETSYGKKPFCDMRGSLITIRGYSRCLCETAAWPVQREYPLNAPFFRWLTL